jgi:bacillopeptidase F (M6 metalloprotease family)
VPYTTVSPRENLVITWSASDNVGVASVSLQYSLNGGTSWNPIAENQPQAGSYTWAIPEGSATTLNIKVIAKDRAGNCGSQTRVVFLKNFADKKYTPGRIGTTVTYPGPSQKEALLRELSK